MNSKEFKSLFGKIAKENDFLQAFGGWYKESPECIAILELQKSKYGDYYMLNVKFSYRVLLIQIILLQKN